MHRPQLYWRLFAAAIIPVVAVLAIIGFLSLDAVWRLSIEQRTADLKVRAQVLDELLPVSLPASPSPEMTRQIRGLAHRANVRISVTNTGGRVIADSQEPHGSESVTYAPEMREALAGRIGTVRRYSSTSHTELLYVAIPLYRQDAFAGVLRIAVPVADMKRDWRRASARVMGGGILAAIAAAIWAFFYARWISRPVELMKKSAEQFAAGNFSARLDVPGTAELGGLALTLNHMAERLDGEIRTAIKQRSEQQAILLSLREGVIALDTSEHVLFVNRAASGMLRLDAERVRGRLLQEVCRISELHRFLSDFLRGSRATNDAEIRLSQQPPQIIQVRGTELLDVGEKRIGTLLVLNDVTTVRRLEDLRRDFVANVSHELKTPITAIKGFIETLRDDETADGGTRSEFLERIARNADRLNGIVEDLLALSRIEQGSEQGTIERREHALKPIAEAAIGSVQAIARERQIAIRLTCPDAVAALVNPALLEQALINLLDNAVKYSEPEREVDVEIVRRGSAAVLHVRDHGWGIEAHHLPRLFERFYRVDKARSRKLGGTGLGLAIVKHIVQAHDGRIEVESKLGTGSTFSIILPPVNSAVSGGG